MPLSSGVEYRATQGGRCSGNEPRISRGPSVAASKRAVSYLFIAIVWINHHHLMRYATEARPRLL